MLKNGNSKEYEYLFPQKSGEFMALAKTFSQHCLVFQSEATETAHHKDVGN